MTLCAWCSSNIETHQDRQLSLGEGQVCSVCTAIDRTLHHDSVVLHALKGLVIGVDFDNTTAYTNWPDEIYLPIPGALYTVRRLHGYGVRWVMWTCRNGAPLDAAIKWVEYYLGDTDMFVAINDNDPGLIETYGTNPRKIGAHVYVDDKGIGVPLLPDGAVNWAATVTELVELARRRHERADAVAG